MTLHNIMPGILAAAIALAGCTENGFKQERLTDRVNPLLGTATLWEKRIWDTSANKKTALGEPRCFRGLLCPMQWYSSHHRQCGMPEQDTNTKTAQ